MSQNYVPVGLYGFPYIPGEGEENKTSNGSYSPTGRYKPNVSPEKQMEIETSIFYITKSEMTEVSVLAACLISQYVT